MKRKWVALSIVILLGCCAMPKPVQAAPQRAPTAYELIDAVNAFRISKGLAPYAIDPILMIAAQTHAEYLASQTGQYSGHVGEGGTDADARAAALGYPQVPGLDINENWASLPASEDLDTLLFTVWGDDQHTHTMLHQMGQHVGAGVAVSGDNVIYVLDVAAFWGDAGLTQQPTSDAYPGLTSGVSVSQYMAPVEAAEPDAAGKVIHQVLQGQTLWSIATAYGVKIDQIRQLNGLTSESMIYTGQKLLIKIIPTPSQVPTTTVGIFPVSSSASPPAQTITIPAVPTSQQVKGGQPSIDDQWLIIAIFAVAILGFILICLGQRSS